MSNSECLSLGNIQTLRILDKLFNGLFAFLLSNLSLLLFL
jgi:hypothetical protein